MSVLAPLLWRKRSGKSALNGVSPPLAAYNGWRDILFRKGDAAGAMYFVVSGRCRLTELGVDILPGEVVGELAMLAPDQSRTQTLECVENGEMLQISYEQVKQLFYQNPQFGFYFLQLSAGRLFRDIARLESELATRKIASAQPTTG